MKRFIISLAFTLLAGPALAAAANPPGTIDLNQHYTDPQTGKIVPNDSTRQAGVTILEPIHDGDLQYAKGDAVTDQAKAREVLAWAEAKKLQYVMQPIDPDCAKCEPLTLGWVLSQAALARACPTSAQQPKNKDLCTDAEEKAEADPMTVLGRDDYAKKIVDDEKNGTGLILEDKERDLLKLLVKSRFAAAPVIAAETLMMLDKDVHPIAFAK